MQFVLAIDCIGVCVNRTIVTSQINHHHDESKWCGNKAVNMLAKSVYWRCVTGDVLHAKEV